MDRSRLELAPGLWLDARRAVWLPEHGVLAVADLHLGYAWAHRASGNLLPLADDGTIRRVRELVDRYQPRELVVLGDVIHGFSPHAALREELQRLAAEIGSRTHLRLLGGNHDRWLPGLLTTCGLALTLDPACWCGPHLLVHGHRHAGEAAADGRVLFGHEHPLLVLSAGVATTARCPAFLIAEDAVLLPAFSAWAAGTSVTGRKFMSPYARRARFERAVAIVAGKLLPLDL